MPTYESGPDYESSYDYGEEAVDKKKLIAEEVFLGNYPFETIAVSIESQFRNYMSTDDTVNYVDIFYNQLSESYEAVAMNDEDAVDCLSDLHDSFMELISRLFEMSLGLGIMGYDDGTLTSEDEEFVVTRAYEYFILGAKHNFKVVIASSINAALTRTENLTETTYLPMVNNLLMSSFNPMIRIVTPEEFLNFTGNREMIDIFGSHRLVGNFLLKYTPRLFKHDDYVVDLVNYITAHRDLGREFRDTFTDQTSLNTETEVTDHGV